MAKQRSKEEIARQERIEAINKNFQEYMNASMDAYKEQANQPQFEIPQPRGSQRFPFPRPKRTAIPPRNYVPYLLQKKLSAHKSTYGPLDLAGKIRNLSRSTASFGSKQHLKDTNDFISGPSSPRQVGMDQVDDGMDRNFGQGILGRKITQREQRNKGYSRALAGMTPGFSKGGKS